VERGQEALRKQEEEREAAKDQIFGELKDKRLSQIQNYQDNESVLIQSHPYTGRKNTRLEKLLSESTKTTD